LIACLYMRQRVVMSPKDLKSVCGRQHFCRLQTG
jgi:hypothetical protein